jgi:hypothetical protein
MTERAVSSQATNTNRRAVRTIAAKVGIGANRQYGRPAQPHVAAIAND